MDAELAGAGSEQVSADADVVTEIEQLVELETFFADSIFLDIDLQLLAVLLDVGESGLAHEANGHDASGDANVDAVLVEFLGGLGRVVGEDLFDRVSEFVFAAIRGLAESFNLLELFAAQIIDMFVECQCGPLDILPPVPGLAFTGVMESRL